MIAASGKGEAGVPRWFVEPLKWEPPLEGSASSKPHTTFYPRTSREEAWELYAARVQEAAGELGVQIGDR